jgi:hypothetical protein
MPTHALPQFLYLIYELFTRHPVEVLVHDVSPGLSPWLRRDADAQRTNSTAGTLFVPVGCCSDWLDGTKLREEST